MSMMVMGRLLCAPAVAAELSSATTAAIRQVGKKSMRGSSWVAGSPQFCSPTPAFAMADGSDAPHRSKPMRDTVRDRSVDDLRNRRRHALGSCGRRAPNDSLLRVFGRPHRVAAQTARLTFESDIDGKLMRMAMSQRDLNTFFLISVAGGSY